MPLNHSKTKGAFNSNVKTLMNDVGKSPHVQSKDQALAIAYSIKGRAFGGVSPQMPQMGNPGGMMSQAFNPSMATPGSNPAMPMGNNPATIPNDPNMPMGQNPVTQPMPQTPVNGLASGIMPPPMMGQTVGLNAGQPGPAGSRGFAFGGSVTPAPRSTFHGPIVSAVPGRTDKHFTHVPSGSFVIPADIVSGHGQGNTLAGMNTLQKLFRMGPHAKVPTIPKVKAPMFSRSKGGRADEHVGKPVPVKLAGGEIVIPPENAHETMCRITGKSLTLDQAHAALDAWVLKHRKKLRKTLAGLPGPARD